MSGKNIATMVARQTDGFGKDVGFTLIDMGYHTRSVRAERLRDIIESGAVKVVNMDVEKGKLVYTNGVADRYTVFDVRSGKMVGRPKAVILNRIEKNGELYGYVVFTDKGTICEVDIKGAVALYNKCGISNGKIKHGVNGDTISSIKDSFPLRQVEITKADGGVVEGKVIMVCKAKNGKDEIQYNGVIFSGDSVAKLTEIREEVVVSNAELIAELKKKFKAGDETDALKIQRIDATSYYAVIPKRDLIHLREKYKELRVNINEKDVAASVMVYDSEGNYREKRVGSESVGK